jgi:hypothetical protein
MVDESSATKADTNGEATDLEERPRWQPNGDNPPGWHAVNGATCILDAPDTIPALWGKGTDVLWAEGESLMIASPPGVGKTTTVGMLIRAQLGIGEQLVFDLPVAEIDGNILYLAMDRPPQISRSMRRQFSEQDRDALQRRLIVRKGPPIRDLAADTSLLLNMAEFYASKVVYVDSVKDAALGLRDDEVGAAYNVARQRLTAAGVQLCDLHHTRKLPRDADQKDQKLSEIYGSTWLVAGAGSVILLTGEAGDLIVGFRHVKPPMDVVGPFDLLLDLDTGTLKIDTAAEVDLVRLVGSGGIYGKSASQCAMALFRTDRPDRAQIEKARRKLDKLTTAGRLRRSDSGKGAGHAATWFEA